MRNPEERRGCVAVPPPSRHPRRQGRCSHFLFLLFFWPPLRKHRLRCIYALLPAPKMPLVLEPVLFLPLCWQPLRRRGLGSNSTQCRGPRGDAVASDYVPSSRDPRDRRGYVPIPPTFVPPKGMADVATSDLISFCAEPQTTQGLRSRSAPFSNPQEGKGDVATSFFFSFFGDPSENRGYVSFMPYSRLPRRHWC